MSEHRASLEWSLPPHSPHLLPFPSSTSQCQMLRCSMMKSVTYSPWPPELQTCYSPTHYHIAIFLGGLQWNRHCGGRDKNTREGACSNCDQRVVLKQMSEGMKESYAEDNVENSRYICESRYIYVVWIRKWITWREGQRGQWMWKNFEQKWLICQVTACVY